MSTPISLLIAMFLTLCAIDRACAQSAAEGAGSSIDSSSADDTLPRQMPPKTWRHVAILSVGHGIPFSAPIRLSRIAELRYDRVGLGLARVAAEEIPSSTPGAPDPSAAVTRFRRETVAVDGTYYVGMNGWLSLFGTVGYSWNSYIDLASAAGGGYRWAGDGTERRVTFGGGAVAEINAPFNSPSGVLTLGLGVYSYHGVMALIGYGQRFNWP